MPFTKKQRTRKRRKERIYSSPDNVIRRHGTKKQQAKAVEGGLCLYRIKGTKQENTRECYSTLFN